MSRYIITGGTGLIGRALCAGLVQGGHEVIVLSRSTDHPAGLPAAVQVVQWDAKTAQGWGHLADGAGAIVNLAGASVAGGRWTEARKQTIKASRANAGAAVTAAVEQAEHRPEVVVQASAVGYYGPRGDEPVAEDAGPGDDFLARVCVAWEDSTAEVEALGVRRVVFRIGVVLSTEDGALPRMLLPFKLFAGGPLGSGAQWFPWIHIDDVVRAIQHAIESSEVAGAYNLSAPAPVTNRDFSQALGAALKRPSWLPVPGFALRLLFGEMASTLLTGQRAIPARLQEAGFHFAYREAGAALRDLLA